MRFSYTKQAPMDNIPEPGDFTNELSRQEEEDVQSILTVIKEYLFLHGKADRRVYRISVPRPDQLMSFTEGTRSVIEHASKVLADDCGWDVKFDLTCEDTLVAVLSVPSSDDDEQIGLFTET